jgi:allantoinase
VPKVADFDFIRAQKMVTKEGVVARAVHIDKGIIKQVIPYDAVPAGARVLDAGNLHVLPGIVDTHVHINDPGRAHWEGFATATQAAAAGGVTTLVDMPLNSIPPTTTRAGLDAKVAAMQGKTHVDVGLCAGLVPTNANDVKELWDAGAIAFKCFLADTGVAEFSHVDEATLARGMKGLAEVGAPLLVHAELPPGLEVGQKMAASLDPRTYQSWLVSRPKAAEDAAIDLLVRLVRDIRGRAHVVHLSSSTALEIVERALEDGLPFSAETCPHYLTFAADEIADGATEYKCAPPIREKENRDKLWAALKDGRIAQVVTDHSPSDLAMKCSDSGDFMKAWGGISSLELGLRAVWTNASARGFQITDIVRWMCEAPARLVSLTGKKGAIDVGYDADFCFFDPDADFQCDKHVLHHKNEISPYDGRAMKGRVLRTILRGETIYDDGNFTLNQGAWIKRS